MSANEWFRIANTFVLPAWILLIFAPRWRLTQQVSSLWFPAILSASYAVILATHWGEAAGDFSTLQGVKKLFSNDWILLGGWIHYLAFDLLSGSWQSRDCLERKIPLLLVAPCLVLTLFFGPAGWLSYQALRKVRG